MRSWKWAFGAVLLAVGMVLLAQSAVAQDALAPSAPARSLGEIDTWYAETLAEGDRSFRVSYLWSKRNLFRAETIVKGHPIVTIVDGPNYYTIDRLSGQGISIERSARAVANDAQRLRPFGDEYELAIKGGGEKIGTESFGGGTCDLYQLTNASGRVKICVTQTNPPLPVKIENFRRAGARTETIRYVNWLAGLPIPDSFFKPSADIEVEHISYDEYLERSARERLGPAPPIYGYLLHGDSVDE